MSFITIHAIDRESSATMSSSFRADTDPDILKKLIEDFINSVPFRKLYLEAENSDGIHKKHIEILDNLNISAV